MKLYTCIIFTPPDLVLSCREAYIAFKLAIPLDLFFLVIDTPFKNSG